MNFRQFFQKFEALKQKFPAPPTHSFDNENSDFGDYLFHCKDAFFSFETDRSNNVTYLFDSHKAINCVDGDYIIESENCYECVDVYKVYNCTYLNYCSRMYDSHFCWDCSDSNDLFGCVHLKFKKYCIFNHQYSKEVYEEKVKKLLEKPAEENLKEMHELSLRYPVTTTNVTNSQNCDFTNHVHYSKNLYLSFDSAKSEDSAYLYDSHSNKKCFDFYQSHNSQWSYECTDSYQLDNCFHMKDCDRVYDSGFCEFCSDSNKLLGCYGLKNQKYFILNKKYSKEEYEKQVKEIMESFKREKES